MSRVRINQSSGCYATAECFDDRRVAFVPTSLRYKIDDVTNGVAVLAYTDISGPTPVTRVPISAAQNAMTSGPHLRETRRITFEVIAPGGDMQHPYAEYDLVRTNPL
jgi:hypothetical protein